MQTTGIRRVYSISGRTTTSHWLTDGRNILQFCLQTPISTIAHSDVAWKIDFRCLFKEGLLWSKQAVHRAHVFSAISRWVSKPKWFPNKPDLLGCGQGHKLIYYNGHITNIYIYVLIYIYSLRAYIPTYSGYYHGYTHQVITPSLHPQVHPQVDCTSH